MIETKSIHKIIDQEEFTHYSQGIYNLGDWEKIGSEILLRSDYGSPEVIFQEAKMANRLFELEKKSLLKLFHTYINGSELKESLFINVYPSTIMHPDFPLLIKTIVNLISANLIHKITFEIIEAERVVHFALLKERIKYLKKSGFQIAIDDIGKGWSSLSMIIEIQPNYLKLDRYFSDNLSMSPSKQKMIQSLLTYANGTKSKVILEGIELETDLAAAKYLGVQMCQGYLIDKPKPFLN
ncbi:EAL domain-containing protein [Neobacillus sp. MM2021_6]|uniref:EAL domain-containing protein n=1 Tax=Bacillaceae TaxID=186817 RepID=UPI00140CF51E|nr:MULTISPECIES: EAL domain-containing protein [Bacillaceae]MBO0961043.1 EAL domain-containing protein [Neobacillus sp. MM2021_6]NHC21331.1 EAL domain-containing protein [Bacillus sp. MM2020_4]